MLQYIYNPMKDVWGLYDIVKCNDASYTGTAKTRVSQGSFLGKRIQTEMTWSLLIIYITISISKWKNSL